MSATQQVQQMQQQQQMVNAMLHQLPQQQRAQIEQAVNNYRQNLQQQGYGNDQVQMNVWTYYTQWVHKMFQENSKPTPSSSESQQAQAEAQQAQQAQQAVARQQESSGLLSGSLGGSSPGLLSGSLGGSSPGLLSGALGGSSVGGLSARQEMMGQLGQRSGMNSSQACGSTSMAGMQGMGSGMSGMGGGMGGMGGGMGPSGMRPNMGPNAMGHNAMGSMGMARKMNMGKGNMGVGGMGAGGMNAMGGMCGEMGKGGEEQMDGMQGGSMTLMAMMSKGLGKMGSMGKGKMDANAANGCQGKAMGTPRPPVMMLRGATPAQRMQMQQAQQQERMQGGWGTGPGSGSSSFGMRPPRAPGTQTAIRPSSSVPNPMAGAAALGNSPKFPPALQSWLQRLFVNVGNSDPTLQKATQAYLRYWVQTWIKTGELWQRNWEVFQLPSVEEIRKNLAPGSLSAGSGSNQVAQAAWPKAPSEAFARSYDRRQSKGSPYRSRSRGGARRESPNFRSRRRRSSSSTRSSRSRRRPRSSRSRSGRSGASSEGRYRDKGKGKGKDRGKDKGKVDKKKEMEDQREKLRIWLNERLDSGGAHVRPKDLTDEMHNSFGVKPGRFRQLFNQTLQQYVNAYLNSGAEAAWPSDGQFSRSTVEEDKSMRAQRAARFSSHLDRSAPVAMVSLADAEAPNLDGGPIIGELHDMCSRAEAKEREMTRQLDKFEWKKGTDAKNPEVNLKFATKKYQRSSADKAYRSQDVRSLEACWKTMEYLMTEILDFDSNPKPGYAIQAIPYIEVYSYLRDRTRAIRVDLHLQQPRSTTQRVFVETHECCLRFEMLSLFLLLGRGQKQAEQATEKYDTKLGLKAISQTIEPLLNAYQAIHERQLAKSILAEAMGGFGLDDDDQEDYSSPFEMATRRYIVLLLMSFSPDAVSGHLAKMSRELLMHPLLTFATQVYAAFHTEDYARFLRMYREADFLTSVCMSGVADLARLRALWLLVRSYPLQVGDKISLSKIKNILAFASDDHAKAFLAFHGLQIVIDKDAGGGANILLPKKGTKEANDLALLQGRLPEKCEFPKGADSLLVAKFDALGMSRAEIACGSADPVIAEVDDMAVADDGAGEPEGAMDEEVSAENLPANEPLTVVA